jgi:anaerobic selenocysteine-containing dehydrogenase
VPEPPVEIHPTTAAARAIGEGDWVEIETPHGRFRACVRLRASLDPRVAVGQHSWWQECRELKRPGYAVLGPDSANYNAAISSDMADPASGAALHRSYLCEIRKL